MRKLQAGAVLALIGTGIWLLRRAWRTLRSFKSKKTAEESTQ
jgi:flagellar biogenesis protein FliO